MLTLTEFLLARIAEDEAVAKAAAEEARGETWHARNYDYEGIGVSPGPDDRPEVREIGPIEGRTPPMAVTDWRDEITDQITRWHPARVLAECEAKRLVVEQHSEWGHVCPSGLNLWTVEEVWVGCRTLAALALPHADHPDYDESWKP